MSTRPKRMDADNPGKRPTKKFATRLLAAGVDWTALGALVREEAARRANAAAQGMLRGGAAGAPTAGSRHVRLVGATDLNNVSRDQKSTTRKATNRRTKRGGA